MSTVPAAVAAGATATICVGETTRYWVAATDPKETPVTFWKFWPLIVMTSPPFTEPLDLSRPLTTGGLPTAVKVKRSPAVVSELPLLLLTVTSTVPRAAAGAVARIAPSDWIVKLVAATEPNLTPVALRKPLPKIVICWPPVVTPLCALKPTTVGAELPPPEELL